MDFRKDLLLASAARLYSMGVDLESARERLKILVEQGVGYDRASEAYTRLYAIIGATGYQPSAQELEAAGMSQEQAEALRHEYLRQTGQLPVEAGGGGVNWWELPNPNPDTSPTNTGEKTYAKKTALEEAEKAANSAGLSTADKRNFVKAEANLSDDEATEWMESRNKKRPDSKTRN